MKLTPHQTEAADLIIQQLLDGKHFRLGGYAGTGKTTLVSSIIPQLRESRLQVKVVAPTGKAASVLRSKGIAATTIHRLCYEIKTTKPLTFQKLKTIPADIVVCDEASMVPIDIYNDLMSYGVPVLFVGDPGQLEPVGKDPKLMHDPDFVLTEVHRQALDNPIVAFATFLRENPHELPFRFKSPDDNKLFIRRNAWESLDYLSFDQIIVGTNKSRCDINRKVRSLLGRELQPHPVPGDKVICLSNSRKYQLFNGMQLTVGSRGFESFRDELHILRDGKSEDDFDRLADYDEESLQLVQCFPDCFYAEKFERPPLADFSIVPFDYSYAITCHKSQGSEYGKVLVLDQAFGNPPNRWRYTAATRAKDFLLWNC